MAESLRFANQTALITGSGRGIGKAIALRLAREGANIVVNYMRNQAPAEETASLIRQMGRKCLVVKANVAKPDEISQLFKAVESEFGGLDIFINNAASGFNRPAMQQRVEGWDWTMNVNARAFLFAAQAAVPLMEKRGGGHIVAITSPGSHRVLPDYVSVGASKAALDALTRYLAVELAPKKIIVNAVSPSLVETDALKYFASLSETTTIPRAIANTPTGRLVTPDDVAGVVAFLCTSDASMICGQVIIVDGGYTLGVPG